MHSAGTASPAQVLGWLGVYHYSKNSALRAPGVPEPIMCVEDGDEEDIKCLCFVYVPFCEMTMLINVFFGPPFAVNIY